MAAKCQIPSTIGISLKFATHQESTRAVCSRDQPPIARDDPRLPLPAVVDLCRILPPRRLALAWQSQMAVSDGSLQQKSPV